MFTTKLIEKMQKKELIQLLTDRTLERDDSQSALYQGKREAQTLQAEQRQTERNLAIVQTRIDRIRGAVQTAVAMRYPEADLGAPMFPEGQEVVTDETEELSLLRHLFRLT